MEEQKQILLVEDEPLLGMLLKQRLERDGFRVLHAKDGEEGLRMLKDSKPSLVLLDIILPKISGFEFLETISKYPDYPRVPILIISNLGQESDVARGKSLGAIGYFVKANLSIEELIEKVKEFFGEKKED